MDKKAALLNKISMKPIPNNFSMRELDHLMALCNCNKFESKRGSGIGYCHLPTNRKVQFDRPHPGKDLYPYHVKKIVRFLKEIKEIEEDGYEKSNGI